MRNGDNDAIMTLSEETDNDGHAKREKKNADVMYVPLTRRPGHGKGIVHKVRNRSQR